MLLFGLHVARGLGGEEPRLRSPCVGLDELGHLNSDGVYGRS